MRNHLLLASLASIAACSPYSPDLGATPYRCAAAEPFCPDGYTCETTDAAERVCVSGSTGPDSPDASTPTFPCADDGALEGSTRNDTRQTAYQTPVDTQRLDLTLAGLAVCPEGDKDFYALTVSPANADKAIEVVVSWDSGQPLAASVLNAGGSSIGVGVAMGDKAVRACLPNMPAGPYYASVFGTGDTKNNYRLSIKLIANCAQ